VKLQLSCPFLKGRGGEMLRIQDFSPKGVKTGEKKKENMQEQNKEKGDRREMAEAFS